ncbi:MAG TPA: cbb3-type cytochrome c oxidase subunit I [Gemmatimonadaceae bacterium]|nr:cbb3-type cytochrome c oxidase subunit I [Gemmatimonadaceae bacterium]
MDPFVRLFIKSSLAWLGCGVVLGVAMAAYPLWIIYRPAHVHMNLLGFVTMMIFGVGYHVLPRVAGAPLRWPRLGMVHWWLANLGLASMVTGFFLIPSFPSAGRVTLVTGGSMAAAGAFCFIINIWRTVDLGTARAAAVKVQRRTILPVKEAIV